MAKMFKSAAKLEIKPAGVKSYMARKAIANWLHEEAEKLLTNHKPKPGGRVAKYNYDTEHGVVGGMAVSIES